MEYGLYIFVGERRVSAEAHLSLGSNCIPAAKIKLDDHFVHSSKTALTRIRFGVQAPLLVTSGHVGYPLNRDH